MNVDGLSIQDILNMDYADVAKLSRKELSKITSRLVSASNKRLRRLEKSDYIGESPAYRSVRIRTGDVRFSVKGKSQGQLQNVFTEAKHFLNLKTSTLKGYKNVIKNIKDTIQTKVGKSISEIDVSKLYDALHKAQESGLVDKRGSKGSEIAVGYIIDMLENNPDKTVDEIVDEINEYSSNMYEELFDYDEDEEFNDWYELPKHK